VAADLPRIDREPADRLAAIADGGCRGARRDMADFGRRIDEPAFPEPRTAQTSALGIAAIR